MSANGPHGLNHFLHSFCYSIGGFAAAWTEEAFRQECFFSLIVLPLPWILKIPLLQSVALNILCLFVFLVELLNSAIEAVVDKASPEQHPLAKRAKDMGSAAVFVALVMNGIAWLAVLWLRYFA